MFSSGSLTMQSGSARPKCAPCVGVNWLLFKIVVKGLHLLHLLFLQKTRAGGSIFWTKIFGSFDLSKEWKEKIILSLQHYQVIFFYQTQLLRLILNLFLFSLDIKNTPNVVSNFWGAVQCWVSIFYL
jgi:hypothetical protein